MRRIAFVSAMLAAVLTLANCGGGGGGGAAGSTVSGTGLKGPYQTGATVTVYQLNTNGTRAAVAGQGQVTDNAGHYTATITPGYNGPFEIVISGPYVDELSGQVVTTPQPTSVVVPDVATAQAGQANVNPIATIQTELAKQAMAKGAQPTAAIQTAGDLALQSFGIPTTDANGNPVSPASVDIFNPNTDPNIAAQVLVASATASALVNQGVNLTTFAQKAATDIAQGKPLGAAGSATAQAGITTTTLNNAQTTVQNKQANLVANIKTATGTAPAVPATKVAQTTLPNPSVIRGMAMQGNTFKVGTAVYTVAANGTATAVAPNTTTAANNVVLQFTFMDYTNANGNGASAGTDLTVLNFDIKSVNDPRHIWGTLDPVKVVRDGLGNVAISVPANATLTYTGIDSQNLKLSGTATNLANNIITTNGNRISIDANALLNTIQNKVKNANPQNVQLNVLQTAGTFTFDFSVGVNVGYEKAAGGGIKQLFPLTATGGRGITGTITTL